MLRPTLFVLAALMGLVSLSAAHADNEENRDEAIFAEDNREDDMFGESDDTESDAESRLDEKLEELKRPKIRQLVQGSPDTHRILPSQRSMVAEVLEAEDEIL